MALRLTLVTVVVLLSRCNSIPLTDDQAPAAEVTTQEEIGEISPSALPLTFRLPKVEQNPMPFSPPEPEPYLKAPQQNQEPNYYQEPIPTQELEAPKEIEWNPSNDPTLFYDSPALIVQQQELPTREFPKKFIQEFHNKRKPFSTRPKQELLVELIDEKEYDTRQKDLQKTFQKLAKKENQKDIKLFKARQAVQV